MDFRILGPLEALDEGESVALGGAKRRAVLALLLLHANETVSAERLVDELWGEQAPATAAKTLQAHVSRLRKSLSGVGGAAGDVLLTRPHGYLLAIEHDRLDANRFERLLADGQSLLADDRPDEALSKLEDALALWRGPPLADLAYEPFAQAEIARLDDLRVVAMEALVEAKLALGRHADVIGTLEGLVDEHPYRERLRAQLMLALYRTDRQADALQAYQNARAKLVEELGIEPGERLRELERAVLAQDPALAHTPPPPPEPARAEPEAPTKADPELPSGVVTFLLTDIEGSSGLWEAGFDAMAASLELHDELIAQAVDAHDGRLLKTKGEGDSTLTVFRRASDAITAAVALQRLLEGADWPLPLGPRVRIALHTGEAHERGGDYFGPALNRGARLRALAKGGSVLLSQTTAEIVSDRLPPGAALVDLGRRELRGLTRPEEVFELHVKAVPGSAAEETRKTVTVLFACVLDPLPHGEGLDAEVRRRVGARCVADMHTVLERHGATVEEYPGESLMAVYGVPQLHEDDAIRAVRAALELRELLGEMADEFGAALALRPKVRIGVGTGEVIAEAASRNRFAATGDAVNTAKRLEERAGPGEILLDDRTHRLVRGFVESEAVEGPEPAVRLLGLRHEGGRPRSLHSPLVGRDQQLEALSRAFEAAVASGTCHLVTVLGAAGVGKSRLVEEFAARLGDDAWVLSGRCLPYGEGITFWPLAEVLRDLPEPLESYVSDDPKADSIVAVLSEAVGLGASRGATSEKIFWGARRLFEAMARRRPLVVVFDDVQWAEPTFLDLVEHVAELARDAPVVLLCMARPELLDARPGWGGGKPNATSILLEALEPDEARELVANLLDRATLSDEAARRLASACEGNPLFAEELLSMLIDEGRLGHDDEGWSLGAETAGLPVPPTIQSLLAARLEQLPDDERALLARVSVVGTVFYREAAAELAPPALAPAVDRCLTALVRRDLIRPDRPTSFEDDTFRFRHILIRDAAYASLPKAARVELHERFADWLERVAAERLTEIEEIGGYHLEQAYRFRSELGPASAEAEAVGLRGSARLEAAGRRALARGDVHAAVSLLERAVALVPGVDARRAALLPDLGAARIAAGALSEAAQALDEADRAAMAAGDESATAHARVQREFLRLHLGESDGIDEAEAVAEQAVRVFDGAGDERGLCAALRLRAWGQWTEGRAEPAAAAWEAAATHASNAGAEHERIDSILWIASSLFFGPVHADEAIRRCEAIRAEAEGNLPAVADVLQPLAGLHAMQGSFELARELLASSRAAFEELGLTLNSAVSHHAATVELLAGDPAAAEGSLRRGYATLEAMGDRAVLSTTAALLGRAVLDQDRTEEAEELAKISAELAADEDLSTQILWRGVRARTLVQCGAPDEAENLAREAVAFAQRTDFLNTRADAVADLGIVLQGLRRAADARAAFEDAVRLYESKGNLVAAERVRAELVTAAGL
jgi:predicted ATPase/class 3 adenylate cyclase/DNA-binding SARP family transcriptional activator